MRGTGKPTPQAAQQGSSATVRSIAELMSGEAEKQTPPTQQFNQCGVLRSLAELINGASTGNTRV